MAVLGRRGERPVKAFLTCVAFCAALTAAPAWAEQSPASAAWTDPTGAFSIDYEAQGWTPIDPADLAPQDGDVLLIEHNGFQASGQMRMCGVRSVVVPNAPPNMPQARANLAVANRTQADFEAITSAPLSSFERTELNGVAVASFSFEQGRYLNFWRLFYLSHGTQTLQVNVTCGMTRPANDAEIANVNAVLGTLRIHGAAQ